ncbi:MAG: nucleotide sugar dehydrogenase [Candidatus Bathyarchaeia archaeon]
MTIVLQEENLGVPEKRKKYTVSVVGCGRIGLATACLFAEAGFRVIGADVNSRVVALLIKGKALLSETGLEELLKKHVKNGSFNATRDIRKAASTSDVIVLVVPTLIDRKKKPDYTFIERTCKEVGRGLRAGSLVIVASTTGPVITETIIKEALEKASGLKAGVDFSLAYSPTRAAPGHVLQDVATYARVVGAINEKSLNVASLVLGTIVKGGIVKVRDMKTAEAIKLFENVHRDVNLALANDFAQFCEKIGIDYLEAQKVANTQPYCHLLVPGIVGGHISEDPYLLLEEAENVNAKLRVLLHARKINDEMLGHTLHLTRDALRSCGKTLRRAKISVFGVSSCPNVKESRGSETKKLVSMLKKKGAFVQVYDPFFSPKELMEMGYLTKGTLTRTVEGADCIIIAVGHDRFRRLNLGRIKFFVKKPAAIVDVGHVIDPVKAEKERFVYRGVGRGVWTR